MWKAVWTTRARLHSSNWKEAETMHLTLQRAKASGRHEVRGWTFFYFTDNIVTYYAMAKGASRIPTLHVLVVACKELEAELGCHLAPVHVPGTTIILQTTDGLSRGVWCTALHEQVSQRSIQSAIFSPLPFGTDMGDWARNKAHLPVNTSWHYRRWDRPWRVHDICDRLTIWTPPPELAAQLIYFLLLVYVEAPLTTFLALFWYPASSNDIGKA
jgi:hypothetical protein